MTQPENQSPAPDASESRRVDATSADRGTESQSAYLRERHRDDAEPGDASADVHSVRHRPAATTRTEDSDRAGGDAAS